NGSLFHQTLEFFDSALLLCHFRRFFDTVLQRQYYQQAGLLDDPGTALTVEYYHVSHDRHKTPRVVQCEASMACEQRGYFNIQVIAAEDETGRSLLTIYCEEREFSSVEYGSDLFKELATHVVRLRHGGQRYPIFITDLDLPPTMLGNYVDGRAPIADFLNYKKSIELKLNDALCHLDDPDSALPLRS
ncbi:MAG: hypothetical protein U1B30_03905, partial [Pseudomonadota bacterium]|nr:hypothetical protein [Pseudomonadota bacterium]